MGLQSKLRLKKGGSGMKVAVGYGTAAKQRPTLIRGERDLENCTESVVLSSQLGAKKTAMLAEKAKELNITILNRKKVRRALKISKGLKKKQKTEKEEKKAAAEKEKAKQEAKTEKKIEDKKMGFDEDVVAQVLAGKSKTYRLRDHGLNVGDKVAFENTQKGEIFGHAVITKTERVPVEKFNLNDPEHYKIYNNMEELIEALKKRNPDKEVTPKTEMFAYTYEFIPEKEAKNS